MSQSIWTQCGGKSNLTKVALTAFRSNASNFNRALLKLVSNLEEYEALEALVDGAKASRSSEFLEAAQGLHYVVRCSYRYPPLSYGSRFGTQKEPGIWYGSVERETTLAECAYYRFRFISSSEGLKSKSSQAVYAVYDVAIKTSSGINLSRPPFDDFPELHDKGSYQATQPLGTTMRSDGVEVVVYPSARWSGTNVAAISPLAFKDSGVPLTSEVWVCKSSADRVIFLQSGTARGYEFPLSQFMVNGILPRPG